MRCGASTYPGSWRPKQRCRSRCCVAADHTGEPSLWVVLTLARHRYDARSATDVWLGLPLPGEGLCWLVNVAYARRRHPVKRQRPNVIHSYQIASHDASDVKHSLINQMTRRSIDALGVADEFADRAASV
jgi:hypothetical protein